MIALPISAINTERHLKTYNFFFYFYRSIPVNLAILIRVLVYSVTYQGILIIPIRMGNKPFFKLNPNLNSDVRFA